MASTKEQPRPSDIAVDMRMAQLEAERMVNTLDETRENLVQLMTEAEQNGEIEDAMFYLDIIEFINETIKFGKRYSALIALQGAMMKVLDIITSANLAFGKIAECCRSRDMRGAVRNMRKFSKTIEKLKGNMAKLTKEMRRAFGHSRKSKKGISPEEYAARRDRVLGRNSGSTSTPPTSGSESTSSGGSDDGISDF